MGRVILPDSDGTPPPPAGQFHGAWAQFVQPGATLVKILSGTGIGRYYLLSSVTVDPVPTNTDEIALTHLDGSALTPGELPTAGALTFCFYARTTFGGRVAPIAVDSGPASWPLPTDITPNTLLNTSTDTSGDFTGRTAGVVRGRIMGARVADPAATLGVPLTMDVPWVVEPGGEIYTKGEIVSDGLVQGDSLRVDGTYIVTCDQTDRTVNVDLRTGQSEEDAAGVPLWRFDRANGWWECITIGGTGDAAIYFPILFTGQLMLTEVQAYENTFGQFVYAALQITAPVWGTPSTAPTVTNANEGLFAGSGGVPWGEVSVNHSLGLGTTINLGSDSYAIRVRATQVGARIRAVRHSVRFTSIGPGGIGG